jgi:hypothetical protein
MTITTANLLSCYLNGGVGAFVDACKQREGNHKTLWAIEQVCLKIIREEPEAFFFLHHAGLVQRELGLVALLHFTDEKRLKEAIVRGLVLGIFSEDEARKFAPIQES